MNWFALLLLGGLLLQAAPVCSQRPLTRQYTVHDGLPSNVVYDIYQDKAGFIWFCTDQGVSRFDGRRFQHFSTKDGLPDNEVYFLREDNFGRCWITCYNNQPCYIRDGQVRTAQNDPLCRALVTWDVQYRDMSRDKYGRSCLIGKKLCVLYRDSVGSPHPAVSFGENPATHALFNGQDLFFNPRGVFLMKNDRLKCIMEPHGGAFYNHFRKGSAMYSFFIGSKNDYWVWISTIDKDTTTIRQRIRIPAYIYGFGYGADSSVLCLTMNGVYSFNASETSVRKTEIVPGSSAINRLMRDHEGNQWITSLTNGVYLQPAAALRIYDVSCGLRRNNVLALGKAETGGLIAAFNDGSVNIVSDGNIYSRELLTGLRTDRVTFINQIGRQTFLMGTDRGLYAIDAGRKSRTLLNADAQKAGVRKGGHYLVATSSSAAVYDIGTKSYTMIRSERTTAIAEDDAGAIWLGSAKGLYTYQAGRESKFNRDSVLSNSRITSLATIGRKYVVIATHKDGLFIWDYRQLRHVGESQGLRSNSCKKVLADGDDQLWLCTDRGLDHISLKNYPALSIHRYSTADGMPRGQINDLAADRTQLYVATPDGIVVLEKGAENKNLPTPRVYILSATTPDTVVNNPGPLELAYNRNDLQIAYTGILFAAGDDVQYRYVLEGGSNDTVYTRLSALNLSAMQPGSYRLLLWARTGEEGAWTAEPAAFPFTIHPPVWQRPWFAAAGTGLLLLFVTGIYRYNIGSVRRSEREKVRQRQQMAELEMQALRAQINPHFMFNALNSIQHFYSQNEERKANHYLTLFSQLIRKTLNYSREHWLTLAQEIDMLTAYIELEQMRFKNAFSFRIGLGEGLVPEAVRVPAMLLQPYVENAINHGLRPLRDRPGTLLLRFDAAEGAITCTIEDNGIGIKAAAANRMDGHKSMGMAITRKRIETLSEMYRIAIKLTVLDKSEADHAGSGTCITITIPLMNYD